MNRHHNTIKLRHQTMELQLHDQPDLTREHNVIESIYIKLYGKYKCYSFMFREITLIISDYKNYTLP